VTGDETPNLGFERAALVPQALAPLSHHVASSYMNRFENDHRPRFVEDMNEIGSEIRD
jgi:hypothetical protein